MMKMPEFKREARKYILERRMVKDPGSKLHDTLSNSFSDNHKYHDGFMEYIKCKIGCPNI